jgi:hypothetical protein
MKNRFSTYLLSLFVLALSFSATHVHAGRFPNGIGYIATDAASDGDLCQQCWVSSSFNSDLVFTPPFAALLSASRLVQPALHLSESVRISFPTRPRSPPVV